MPYTRKNEGFVLGIRRSLAARQIADRSEWAVNAVGAVMLAVPQVGYGPPSSLLAGETGAAIAFGADEPFEVPVQELVRPFLERAHTVLVVSFKRTRIVGETTLFVTRRDDRRGGT